MKRPVVHGLPHSVYTRIVVLTLEEKKVAFDFQTVDPFTERGLPASYLRVHPFGRIPALTVGAFSLYETAAICRYLDEAFDGPSLQPENTAERARVSQIINVLDAYAYRAMVWGIYVERVANPSEGVPTDEARVKSVLPVVERVLSELSVWLDRRRYLASDRLTLADLHALPMLHYLSVTPEGHRLLAAHPNLQRWMRTLGSRPSVINMTNSDP